MMKKLFSILLLATVLPLSAWAQDSKGSIIVTLNSGAKVSIPRGGIEKITIEDALTKGVYDLI